MQDFIDSLVADKRVPDDSKITMLKIYELEWSEAMATSTQSKEQLESHLASLKIIEDARIELEKKVKSGN